MARGQKTGADKVAEFRGHYLVTRNAAAAARRCDIPERTGRKLAEEAESDASFAEACRKYLARGLDKASSACLETLDILMDGLRKGPLSDAMGSPIDRRAELARAVTSIRDSLDRTEARAEARAKPSQGDAAPVTVVVNLKPPCPPSSSISLDPSPEPMS